MGKITRQELDTSVTQELDDIGSNTEGKLVQSGVISFVGDGSSVLGQNIVFDQAFSEIPAILLTSNNTNMSSSVYRICESGQITTTGMLVRIKQMGGTFTNGSTYNVSYTAVGKVGG